MKKTGGFTMVETLVSMAILTIAIMPLLKLGISYRIMVTDMKLKSEAMTAAQRVAEGYRQGVITTLPSSGTQTQTISLGNRSYVVNTDICTATTYCTTATRDFIFRVSLNGKERYRMQAIFSEIQ